jgi:hypothetical protein
MKKRTISVLVALAPLWACQPDEPGMAGRDAITIQDGLTGGSANSKRWVVETATLKPASNSNAIDITNLANVQDDEFVFQTAGGQRKLKLEWKLRNDIKAEATSGKEALLDFYRSPRSNELTIQDNGEISSDDSNLKISWVSENKVRVQLSKGTTELAMELTPENMANSTMTSSLQFNKISEISGVGMEQAAGFTGSMASNSLYIAYKSLEEGGNFPERVLRFDLASKAFQEVMDFVHPDFVTKELHIINDELKVVGAQFVNTYSLDLEQPPTSVPHGLKLTRYGSTVVDNEVYLFGGDLNGLNGNKIYRHDQATGQLTEVGILPEPRYWAHGEMVDGKLFVFGGRQSFTTEQAEDDIFAWDAATGATNTYKLPESYHRTFAARKDHRIFVAGQQNVPPDTVDGQPVFPTKTAFGYFDTRDNTFHSLSSSLAGTSASSVYGLTIVEDHIYVLYGNPKQQIFSVYEASLEE